LKDATGGTEARSRLLYLGPPETLECVRAHLPEAYEVELALDETSVDACVPACDVILDAYMRVRFTADRLGRAERLKLVVTATTGADHIDQAALSERRIPLLTLRGQTELLRNLTPAAEHSWLLLMACARRLRGALDAVVAGQWDRNQHPGLMLRGKTLGIIGCGRIGQWMARYAAAFGMNCLGYDPHLDAMPEGIESSELHALLRRSDFVSVHVPLNDETRRLLGPTEMRMLKHGAIVVNTSRGEIIDEDELLSALREGRIAAAGLDVLTGEPDIQSHPLVRYAQSHDNLLITPHIGGFSPDALNQVLAFSCRRIVEFFRG